MEQIIVKIKRYFRSLLYSYRKIPDKKVYVEFITALMSIPVLATVILLNINNLKSQSTSKTTTAKPEEKVYIYISPSDKPSPTASVSRDSQSTCNSDLPPVSITSPEEGETVSDNPVSITISYKKQAYCAIVWSYRINNGSWSDYDDSSISLYNPPAGRIKVDLKIKSVITGESETISRTFTSTNASTQVTPTLTPDTKVSSSSGSM